MWKLIILLLLSTSFNPIDSKPILLIIDDCKEWKEVPLNRNQGRYAIYKDIPKYYQASISHNWLEPETKLSTISMSISEIQNSNPIYSSKLTPDDWAKLSHEKDKVYILKPNDFCSENRFSYNFKFELLEVKVFVSADE